MKSRLNGFLDCRQTLRTDAANGGDDFVNVV